jgi:FkbM family methyltransferase
MILKQVNGAEIDLNIESGKTKEHFDNPRNYAQVVIEEFNANSFADYISKEDKVILDIGANIGLFALHVAPYAERIICVEPTESHNQVFNELIEQQGYQNKVELESSALHNYTGTVGYHIEGVNTTMNKVNVSGMGIEVPCITLADLCEKYNLKKVDFCKIDIESSEFAAITVETLRPVNQIIDKISIEVHPPNREGQDHFIKIFEECGYKTKYIDYNAGVFAYK